MGLYEGIKDTLKIAQKIDNIDLYKKVLEVQMEALELVQKIASQQDEIAALKARNAELQGMLSQQGKVVRHNNLYFDADENGAAVGYAYCTRCYEVDKRLIHIVQDPAPTKRHMSNCPQCKASFNWWGRANRGS